MQIAPGMLSPKELMQRQEIASAMCTSVLDVISGKKGVLCEFNRFLDGLDVPPSKSELFKQSPGLVEKVKIANSSLNS